MNRLTSILKKKNGNKPSTGKHIFYLSSFFIGIATIVSLFLYLNKNLSVVNLLEQISVLKTANICFAGFLISTVSMALTQLYMTRSLNCRLNFIESYALSILTRSGNTLTPYRLGTIYRAAYLKKNHQLSLVRFGSLFVGLQLVLILTSCLVSGAALAVLSKNNQYIETGMMICFFSVFVLCCFFLFFSFQIQVPVKWINNGLNSFFQGWRMLQNDKTGLLVAISGRMVGIITYTVIYYYILNELGSNIDWTVCLFLTAVSSLTMLVQIIPGSLGITELTVTLAATQFSLSPAVGFSAALLIRFFTLVYLIVFTLPSWIILNKFNKL